MTRGLWVTTVCDACDGIVEVVLFADGVDQSHVAPWAIDGHAETHGHRPTTYRFLVTTPRRKGVR